MLRWARAAELLSETGRWPQRVRQRHDEAVQINWWRVKRVVNWVNLTTPLGLLIARLGQAAVGEGERGLLVGVGYRLRFPVAPAFTVGNVIISPHDPDWLAERPRLLKHEERHTWQYLACIGLPMLPLYGLAALWSYARCGQPGLHNPFEQLAGLADGGYVKDGSAQPSRDPQD
jgi:hypothetical protein